jgi:uncharacterized protein
VADKRCCGDREWWLGLVGLIGGGVAGLMWWRRQAAQRTSPLLRASEARSGRTSSALVTGASSGIGLAYATRLASMGYSVILVARRRDRLESLASELTATYGVKATALPADLTTEGGVSLVEQAIVATEDLAMLVNNAGVGIAGPFARGDINRHLNMIQLHVQAVVRLTRAALPGMLARRRGAVVNVSSLMAYYPLYGSSTYAGTKCYLRAFTEALHQELVNTGLRAQSLCPGFVRTELQGVADIASLNIPDLLWMTPEAVVDGSLRDLQHDRVISVPGLGYRLLATVAGMVPRSIFYLVGRWLGITRSGGAE